MIGIISALPEELQAIRRAAQVQESHELSSGRLFLATIGRMQVWLGYTGDGPKRASEGLQAILSRTEPDSLLFIGIAGGLTPTLDPGDLLVSSLIRGTDGETASGIDPGMREQALRVDGTRAGLLVTAGEVISTVAEKEALCAGLEEDLPAAVDVESMVWARVASRAGIPYIVVRAVADTAKESLPSLIKECVMPDGSVHRGRVVVRAMLRPRVVPALLRLRRRTGRCAERLRDFVTRFLVA